VGLVQDITLVKNEIGGRLKACRLAKGMTQEYLSEKVDIGTQSLSNIECGTRFFSIDVLLKLIDVLDVSADYILTGKHNINNPITDALASMSPKDAARMEQIILLFQEAINEK